MAELTDKQKRYAVIGAAGLVLLYLLYHYYAGNKASNQASTGTTPAPDTSGSDYAALAGQEQGDVAALQGALNTLTGQEQSDVTGLNSTLGGLGSQEQSDVSGLTGLIGTLTVSLVDPVPLVAVTVKVSVLAPVAPAAANRAATVGV